MSKTEFAMAMPKWVADIDDKDVQGAVFALLFGHNIDKQAFTESGLKKELDEFDDMSTEQKQQAFDLIVSHKDEK